MLIKSHEQLNQAVCETFFPRNCQRWDHTTNHVVLLLINTQVLQNKKTQRE